MATKLARKQLPAGFSADDFKYEGRPAKDQDDFGSDVGIADMACVNQFGEANNSKHYHAGVVTAKGKWFVYLEWGRIAAGKSWVGGSFQGQDFQFVECVNEGDARAFFQKQAQSKNVKRLQQSKIGGKMIWTAKVDKNGKSKDGYIVQSLATRERGLPDAYSIKDDSGVEKKKAAAKKTKKAAKKAASAKKFQPQVVDLANSLVGGTRDYARAAQKSTGIVPTMDTIIEVRDEYIPLALERLAKIGGDVDKQIKDKKLIQLSKLVAALVPRPIPRGNASAETRAKATILSSDNIFTIQQDLDAFEAALKAEDFGIEESDTSQPDAFAMLGAKITWIDPRSEEGKWLAATYAGMTNNRHGHLRNKIQVKNIFAVERPALDKAFVAAVGKVAQSRKGKFNDRPRLQPKKRNDVSDISDNYGNANVGLMIHGTRAVNVQPIISSNLRLPRALKGVQITGSAFGHGIYFATDWRKSHGYTGHSRSYYGGGGMIKNRGFFMFLCDVIMGKAHMARSTMWNAVTCPRGADSIAAFNEYASVANDEHVIFDPNYQRIRYIIEGDLR